MSGASLSEMSARLREDANDHPVVGTLCADLPELPEGAAEPGLYVATGDTAGILVNGELRVSLVRIMSVGEDGASLVGQIQVTRELDHPLTTWELRFYLHDAERYQTIQVDDADAWFVRLLEKHYEGTGASVDLEPTVEA